ncbi:MAG: response regulator transcription factor [Clostridiales bacterium]|nr:response regulator transcription factor [Clostridiales bacterium]
MIKAAIVEDNLSHAKTIEEFLMRCASECGRTVDVVSYQSGEEFLHAYDKAFDLVFLDIELPDKDGMTVAREIREIDKSVLIIFVTNLAQYAINGYDVSAFDFIIKPVGYYNFAMKLRRAFESLASSCKRKIWVTTRQGKQMIDAEKLKYVEVMQHTLVFHMTDGTVSGTGTLKSVQSALAGMPFELCNRCYLVNLHYVTQIDGNSVCVGGEYLQISVPKKKDFLSALNKFLAIKGG